MAELSENNIEWYTGNDKVTLSFSQKRFISKIKRYAKDHPEVEIVAENSDGSICAHVPLSWIKISPKRSGRILTEQDRAMAAERLKLAREAKKLKEEN